MPRVNTSQRQKNRPFKNKSKQPKTAKAKSSTKTKHIAKVKGRVKNTRNKLVKENKDKKTEQLEKLSTKNEYLDLATKSIVFEKLKNETEIKIVVLFPGNKDADTNQLLLEIYQHFSNIEGIELKTEIKGIPYKALQIIPSGKCFLKNKIMLISGARERESMEENNNDIEPLHDLIKCADIICPVLSCKSTNTKGMNLDPYKEGGAFDQLGYIMLNMIRSMGTPTTIGIVQDLVLHQIKNHDKIERLFKRFISSELGEKQSSRIAYLKGNQQQYNKLLRLIDSTSVFQQSWKAERGYLLVEDVTCEQNSLTFHGYLKGNCVHANQLVHVTGFDDYEIEKIEIKNHTKFNSRRGMSEEEFHKSLVQFSTTPESLFPFSKAEQVNEDLLSALDGLKIASQEPKQEEMESEYEDNSDEEQGDEDIDEYFGNKQEQKAKRVEMHLRTEDELEFEDEVEYPAEDILRQKFKDYQGLKNFKTSEWNHLQNLPDEYDRIYTFKHYTRTHRAVLEENQAKAFAYPGFYISVTIKNFPQEKLQQHCLKYPTIVSFLLKHERKMTQLHAKVRRNPFYPSNETVVESNQNYLISMGFRRFVTRPIFSKVINGSDKTKFIKGIKEDYQSYFYCSFYYLNYFPPAPVQIYRVNQFNFADKQSSPIMYGELAKCDPLHIILQRIILTGYPFKVYKRRSTVRFMFFNPKDVKYFKPVEVRTKLGLKGRIEESIGTHGYMKVLFSDKIKYNDTVWMSLYRRVYPEPNF